MLILEKFGSFDPEPKTLWTFLELLSELNSTVNVVSDISDEAEGTEFYRVAVVSESSKMSWKYWFLSNSEKKWICVLGGKGE